MPSMLKNGTQQNVLLDLSLLMLRLRTILIEISPTLNSHYNSERELAGSLLYNEIMKSELHLKQSTMEQETMLSQELNAFSIIK